MEEINEEEIYILDEDGYPNNKTLNAIENYSHEWGYQNLMENIAPLFEGYGRCEYRDIDDIWEVATGGWSGNEDIIGALQDNTLFWTICWNLSKRGGYYEFKCRPIVKAGD